MMRCHQQLFIFLPLIIAIIVCGCSSQSAKSAAPKAVKGVLDLREWDFEADGPIDFAGEFEFYWEKQYSPEDFSGEHLPPQRRFINVPGSWNGYHLDDRMLSGSGFATYRVRVLFNKKNRALAFKLLDMGTSYTIYAEGRELLAVGKAGANDQETVPQYLPTVVDFAPKAEQTDIIFHVSNFRHKLGGPWENIRLGLESQLRQSRENKVSLDLFLFGCFVIICIYHIGLFALGRKDKPSIYFSIFCFLIAFRTISTGERFLFTLLHDTNWEILVKIEYLSAYCAVPLFGTYLYHLFRKDFHLQFLWFMQVAGICFAGAVLFTPVSIFSHTALGFQVFSVICLAYGFHILTRSVARGREGATVVLFGFVLLTLATVNDILDINEVIHTGHWVPIGFLVFVLLQAYLIALRFSTAFATIESQHEELTKVNKNYQKEIAERKRAEEEKKRLEEKLVRSEKMEAMGLLAGGIGHDLNNILSGIVSYPDLLLMKLPEDSPLRRPLLTMRESGLKAVAIVQDLLTLARRGIINMEVLNLSQLVSDYLDSPEHHKLKLNHPNIRISTELPEGLLNTKGSPIHIQKALMNLVINAAEAQPSGGEIKISTHNRYIDLPIDGYDEVKEGDYVVLTIRDDGIGIAEVDRRKIFEPFYTRKVMGRSGTGLGMSVVWGMIQDHQGYIDIISEEGNGTSFELYLPATREAVADIAHSIPVEMYRGNGESILVIDDVLEQRMIAADILSELGYNVNTVASGEEAIRYMNKNSCDLLLLDMIMDPGQDGLDTYRKILVPHPGMKAIIASGYSETERVKKVQELGAGIYIKKPYTLEKIGMAVKTELKK